MAPPSRPSTTGSPRRRCTAASSPTGRMRPEGAGTVLDAVDPDAARRVVATELDGRPEGAWLDPEAAAAARSLVRTDGPDRHRRAVAEQRIDHPCLGIRHQRPAIGRAAGTVPARRRRSPVPDLIARPRARDEVRDRAASQHAETGAA